MRLPIRAILLLLLASGCVTETVKPSVAKVAGARRIDKSVDESVDESAAAQNTTPAPAANNGLTSASLSPDGSPAKPAKNPSAPISRVDPNDVVDADPCAANMQQIAGALLLYYATKHQMPERLRDIIPMADSDTLKLECPASKMPYSYSPEGLRAEGKTKVIVVYDAAATHSGVRWCIVMSAPKSPVNRSLEVVAMPESQFLLYR